MEMPIVPVALHPECLLTMPIGALCRAIVGAFFMRQLLRASGSLVQDQDYYRSDWMAICLQVVWRDNS